ncbi:MAG: DUF58 domain-containing protein [Candidatus Spechtbacterales bacterium]|nr:DUF58 domain-containing protein [Candidatus Spechtbacterales bacterium]
MRFSKFEEIFNIAQSSGIEYKVRLVRNLLYGEYNSVYIGEGLEFAKFEEFGPDSDPRQIDIVASLKSDSLLVARERERREARLLVVCDVSPSMMLREKPEIALRGIATLLFSALDQHIRTGLMLVGSNERIEVRPGLGNKQLARVRDALASLYCSDREPLSLTSRPREERFKLSGWEHILTQDSYIAFFSDFLGSDRDYYIPAADEYNGRYRIVPVVVQDDLEHTFPRDLPRVGSSIEMVDPESEEISSVLINRKTGIELANAHENRFEQLEKLFEEKELPFAHLNNLDMSGIYSAMQEVFNAVHALRR